MTSAAERSATIWRVTHPPSAKPAPKGKRNMGKVIEARLSFDQATEKAEALRKARTPCTVNRI